MKILYVTKGFQHPNGGAEYAAKRLFKEISTQENCDLLTDYYIPHELLNTRVYSIFPRRPHIPAPLFYPIFNYLGTKKLREILEKNQYDIIHVHSHAGFLITPPQKIPSLITFHDAPFLYRIPNNLTINSIILTLQKEIELIIKKKSIKDFFSFHALSSFVENNLISNGVEKKSVIKIPNGSERYSINGLYDREKVCRSLGIQTTTKIIVTIGGIHYRRGIHVLLDAVHQRRREFKNCMFIIIGDTSNFIRRSNYKTLLSQVQHQKLSNIKFTGHISRKLLLSILYNADCYVSPSLSEACNLSILDAMTFKLPIVATTVGSVNDIKYDLLFPVEPNNSHKLADQILQALSTTKKATYIPTTWNDMGLRVVQAYHEILKNKKNR